MIHDTYEQFTGSPSPQPNHCLDCCCARSWAALGITKMTGKSIPEHIEEIKKDRTNFVNTIHWLRKSAETLCECNQQLVVSEQSIRNECNRLRREIAELKRH